MDTIVMLFFLIIFLFSLIFKVKLKKDNVDFFSKNDTLILKYFWAIVVILVHIPIEFKNIIQDLMGSFGYVGVTFFFISSAYGLRYSISKNKKYLDRFFSKRIFKVLLPMFLVSLIIIFLRFLILGDVDFSFSNLFNAWVIRLVIFYIAFWFFYKVLFNKDYNKADLYMILFVLIYSLLGCFHIFENIFRWNVESFGFIVGIIIFNHKEKFRFSYKRILLSSLFTIMFGILYLKYKNVVFIGDYLLRILLSFSINYFSFQVIDLFSFGNKINNLIGNVSYEMYLSHPGIIYILESLFPDMNSSLFILCTIIITIVFSIFVHNLINKKFKWR